MVQQGSSQEKEAIEKLSGLQAGADQIQFLQLNLFNAHKYGFMGKLNISTIIVILHNVNINRKYLLYLSLQASIYVVTKFYGLSLLNRAVSLHADLGLILKYCAVC